MKNTGLLKVESVQVLKDDFRNESGNYLLSHRKLVYKLLINGTIDGQKVYFYTSGSTALLYSGLSSRIDLKCKKGWFMLDSKDPIISETVISSHDRLADQMTITEDKREIVPAINQGDLLEISYKVAKEGRIANRLNFVKLIK